MDAVKEPRRPGRPRLDPNGPSIHVSVTVPVRVFDDLCDRASRECVSVPEVIRRDLSDADKHRK